MSTPAACAASEDCAIESPVHWYCELQPMRFVQTALAAFFFFLSCAAGAATSEEVFEPALTAREEAEAVEAAVLAPGSYGKGIAALERAQRERSAGVTDAELQAGVTLAAESFAAATRAAGVAREQLKDTLAKRETARDAEAFRLAVADWAKAETALSDAARRLEKGDGAGALKSAAEATERYDEAELRAIKSALLNEARSVVVGMDAAGTAKLAPKTSARATELLRQAEAELDADRTRRDAVTKLAAEATREARHAVALAEYLRSAREAGVSAEDYVLEWERALALATAAAGTTLSLDDGPRTATDGAVAGIAELQSRATQQAAELEQRNRQIVALEDELRELDGKLAGVSSEARSLTERLEARERAREQFERLESVFTTDQALVFRQGDAIIVRAPGLAFASGSAQLTPKATPMLEKLREVVAVYPSAQYAVEGHTDSSGDSRANQRLSQSRADAVRTYLVNQLNLSAGRVSAVGYGDSKPVAKNETSDGRRLNRRIDLVITPRESAAP